MSKSALFPAIFLDRDGVIIVEKHFQIDIDKIEFLPRALDALLKISGIFKLIVISNQSGVGRGYFTLDEAVKFNSKLHDILLKNDVEIDDWYICPHTPDDNCTCRKPRPGMLLEAASNHSIDFNVSYLIGDKSSDIAAGKSVGVKTILVRSGYGGREEGRLSITPDFEADDIYDAVLYIMAERNSG